MTGLRGRRNHRNGSSRSGTDVFGYIRSFPDGREEGNTTGAILKKMQ